METDRADLPLYLLEIREKYLTQFGKGLSDLIFEGALERELAERHRQFFLHYTRMLSNRDLVAALSLLNEDEVTEWASLKEPIKAVTKKPEEASPEVPRKAAKAVRPQLQARSRVT